MIGLLVHCFDVCSIVVAPLPDMPVIASSQRGKQQIASRPPPPPSLLACSAPEAVRGLRKGTLPPHADPEGREGASEAVPDDEERGERWPIYAYHHASAGESRPPFSGVRFLLYRLPVGYDSTGTVGDMP